MTIADNEIAVDEGYEFSVLKKQLEWPNPEYVKRVEAGRSVWNVPRNIVLWKQKGDSLIVPFGMLQWLRNSGINVVPTEHLKAQKPVFSGLVDNLYDYQEEAVNRGLKAKTGYWSPRVDQGKHRSDWRCVRDWD